MTRLMFDFWLHKKWLTQLKMMRLFERPAFNPMKYRWHFFTLTTVLTVAGLGLFLARGVSGLNVDFRGGTVYGGKLKEGEEMALSPTGDRPGLRDLLAPGNQRKRLKATDAHLLNAPPGGDLNTLNTFEYEIKYDDGGGKVSTATVTLTEKPAGADEKAMADSVVERGEGAARAVRRAAVPGRGAGLPAGPEAGTSPSGRPRSRRELVQVSLDRLLRDEAGKSLLAGATMTVNGDKPVTGPGGRADVRQADQPRTTSGSCSSGSCGSRGSGPGRRPRPWT